MDVVPSKVTKSEIDTKPKVGTSENKEGEKSNSILNIGLKFTGFAARVVGDIAQSVGKDAERLLTEFEQEMELKVIY